MMQLQSNKKIAYISLLIALSIIFSYVESMIPLNFGIPGVKVGLANIVSVIALQMFGVWVSVLVIVLRVLLSGVMFGNAFSIIYSLAGGIVSVIIMAVLNKTNRFSIIGISIGGGVFHNLGQLFVACIVIEQLKLAFYGPILIISGVVMGTIVGIISKMILKRIPYYNIK